MRFKDFLVAEETRVPFDFSLNDVKQLWREINHVCFEGDLHEPLILIEEDLAHLLTPEQQRIMADRFGTGQILGYCDEDPETGEVVLLFCSDMDDARELVAVVAHEMVHQALAEKHGYRGMLKVGHGPEFMGYAADIKKYHNTKLLGPSY